ncbi:DMT family transporter, partial [Ralstonia pseudosolanacearum]|uniref:DMT family transporter n=1 Tax=Ralstonia pseudosolanacearum TaxID=1310165 RepID=UPI003221C5BC
MATATDPARRPLDGTAIGLMVVLCLCWGLQQVAIKVAVHDVGPVMQAGVRSAIASVLVLAFALPEDGCGQGRHERGSRCRRGDRQA